MRIFSIILSFVWFWRMFLLYSPGWHFGGCSCYVAQADTELGLFLPPPASAFLVWGIRCVCAPPLYRSTIFCNFNRCPHKSTWFLFFWKGRLCFSCSLLQEILAELEAWVRNAREQSPWHSASEWAGKKPSEAENSSVCNSALERWAGENSFV